MILSPFIYKQTHRKKLQGELDKTDTRSDRRDNTCTRTNGPQKQHSGREGIHKTKLMEDARE